MTVCLIWAPISNRVLGLWVFKDSISETRVERCRLGGENRFHMLSITGGHPVGTTWAWTNCETKKDKRSFQTLEDTGGSVSCCCVHTATDEWPLPKQTASLTCLANMAENWPFYASLVWLLIPAHPLQSGQTHYVTHTSSSQLHTEPVVSMNTAIDNKHKLMLFKAPRRTEKDSRHTFGSGCFEWCLKMYLLLALAFVTNNVQYFLPSVPWIKIVRHEGAFGTAQGQQPHSDTVRDWLSPSVLSQWARMYVPHKINTSGLL